MKKDVPVPVDGTIVDNDYSSMMMMMPKKCDGTDYEIDGTDRNNPRPYDRYVVSY